MSNPKHKAWLGMVLIGVALALLPFLVGKCLGNSWVRVLDFALLYVMLALGLNIVVGVGAYLYALLASPHFGLHWPVWAVLPLGALAAGLFGVLLGAPTLRLRGDYLAIVTLGFGEIVRIFINNLNAPVNITNGPQGISLPSLYLYYFRLVPLPLLIVFVSIRLEDSRIGRAWVAIREDEIAAKACGINTRNVKLLAFAMGASFGGVAGGLFAGFQQFVSPESFTLLESIMVLCMVVFCCM